MKILLWTRDPHPGPHRMKNGGCYCTCTHCIKMDNKRYRCICLRCNEDCTGIGRLGVLESVLSEQARGYPDDVPVASRWYRG